MKEEKESSVNQEISVIINKQIEVFKPYKQDIINLVESAKSLKIDGLEDKQGLKVVYEKRQELKKSRIKIEKDRKEITGVLDYAKKNVMNAANELLLIIEPEESRLLFEEKEIERLKEIEAEKIKQAAENRLSEMRQKLFDAGLNFNGKEYVYESFIYSEFELKIATDQEFEKTLIDAINYIAHTRAQKEIERIEKEEEEKRQAEQKAEADRIEAERLAEIKRQQEELNRQKEEQKAEADRIEAEKHELYKIKNQSIFDRLVKAGADPEELFFEKLHEMSQAEIETSEKYHLEQKAKIQEMKRRDEEIRVEKENKLNDAAVLLKSGGSTKTVLECKNYLAEQIQSGKVKLNDLADFVNKIVENNKEMQMALEIEAENAKSDKLKITQYVEKLQAIPIPEIKSKAKQKLLDIIYQEVHKFSDYLK